MDGVVHNPDILQVSNEADLSTGIDTINSVEHKVYMEKRAENQEADIQVLFFLPTYIIRVSICPATTSLGNNCFSVQRIN